MESLDTLNNQNPFLLILSSFNFLQHNPADYYYSAEGWGTDGFDTLNYNGGQLYQEDVYSGNKVIDSALLRRTVNTYTGFNGLAIACNTQSSTVYPNCNPLMISSRVTTYDGTGSANSSAPWVQTNSTYDDYDPSKGLILTGAYHNLLSSTVYSSNAPKTIAKSSYLTTDQVAGVNNDIYYNVAAVSHSELDDSTGHVWQCQDTTYDENSSPDYPTLGAGWPTTQTAYSDCRNQSQTALTNYTAYDAYGNVVATVDSFGANNSSLYNNTGCMLSTAPTYLSNAWTTGRYTSCTVYDSYNARPVQTQNVLGQQTTTSYDYAQGGLPVSTMDANGQTTTTNYSYDSISRPRFCQNSNNILASQPYFCSADRIKTGFKKECWSMNCPHCAATGSKKRMKKTKLGYLTFFCPQCRSTFNERTGTPFNSLEFPTDSVLLAVVWRLRYKLSLRDVAEMFLERGFTFTHEAIRDWEARFASRIADQLRTRATRPSREILVR